MEDGDSWCIGREEVWVVGQHAGDSRDLKENYEKLHLVDVEVESVLVMQAQPSPDLGFPDERKPETEDVGQSSPR